MALLFAGVHADAHAARLHHGADGYGGAAVDAPPEQPRRPARDLLPAGGRRRADHGGRRQGAGRERWRFPPHPLQSSVRAGAPRDASPRDARDPRRRTPHPFGAWERGGGVSVREALSERLGITVDRYAALSRDIFIRIAQKTGTVVFTLPYAISYERDGYSINIPAGERRLDAQDVADVFSCPVFEGGALGKSELLGDLAAAIVNQNLDAAGEKLSSGLFKLAVNLVDTDVSAADYELRRDACTDCP